MTFEVLVKLLSLSRGARNGQISEDFVQLAFDGSKLNIDGSGSFYFKSGRQFRTLTVQGDAGLNITDAVSGAGVFSEPEQDGKKMFHGEEQNYL